MAMTTGSGASRGLVSRGTLLLATLLSAVALAACAGESGSDSGAPVPNEAVEIEASREIIRNADMALRVDDVRDTVSQVSAITEQSGGRIASESVSSSGESFYANVTARVPAQRLDDVIAQVSGLGEVTFLNVFTDDVTAQGADLDARIEALQVSIKRLQELLAEAQTTQDILAIETELTTRQAELDSILAQRAALSDAVDLSTLTISINPRSEGAAWTPPGFVAGLESGWSAVRTLGAALITFGGFLVPFLGVALVVAVPIVAVVLLLRRRR